MLDKPVPENEMGVVALFAMDCQEHGWTIERIGAKYPDAIIRNVEGETYRAEFEFVASNFRDHKHDPRECDLIICWVNDWHDCLLPVLCLQDWSDFHIRRLSDEAKEIMHLRLQNATLKRQLAVASNIPGQLDCPGPGWRMEIVSNGKYFQWRKGRAENRQSIYGGPVSELPKEVLAQYLARKNGTFTAGVPVKE
jgi:hypothetical protein